MLPIAGQMAKPNGLKFFVDTHEKNSNFFFKFKKNIFIKYFFPRATPSPSASNFLQKDYTQGYPED